MDKRRTGGTDQVFDERRNRSHPDKGAEDTGFTLVCSWPVCSLHDFTANYPLPTAN